MKLKKLITLTALIVVATQNTNVSAQCDDLTQLKNEIENPSCLCLTCPDGKERKRKEGIMTVAVDNNGAPVKMAYTTQGKKSPDRPTIVFCDNYLGPKGWKCQQELFSKCFFTISYDQIGWGGSSKPAPTALDGVGGQAGYSYGQWAFFVHELLKGLNVNSPIIMVAVDIQGNAALKYIERYAQDPFALSKLVLINCGPQSVVSDDPCQLAYLNVAQAQAVAQFYAVDPCAALCAVYASSFTDPKCPEAAKKVLNAAVNYNAAVPPIVYQRLVEHTVTEDTSPILQHVAIPTLYLYSVVNTNDLLSRKAQAIVFAGYCPLCPNPVNPGTCVNGVAVEPIKDCRLKTYPGKGTAVWITDHKRVNRDMYEFFIGCDLECCPCPLALDIPVICATCA